MRKKRKRKKTREQVPTYLAALGLRHLSPEHHAAGRVLNSHKRRRGGTRSRSVAGQREVARMRRKWGWGGGRERGNQGRAPPLRVLHSADAPAVRAILLTLPKVHRVQKMHRGRRRHKVRGARGGGGAGAGAGVGAPRCQSLQQSAGALSWAASRRSCS